MTVTVMADCLSKVCILLQGTALLLRTSCLVEGYISQPPYFEGGHMSSCGLWNVSGSAMGHLQAMVLEAGHGLRALFFPAPLDPKVEGNPGSHMLKLAQPLSA